jgi:D-aminoacyl-tRNA deacylase
MTEASGAAAAYIDRKSFGADELASLSALLRKAGLPVVTGSEITGLGSLGMDTYLKIRDLARNVVKGGMVSPNALSGQGEPVVVDIGEDLARAALQADPGVLSEGLSKVPAACVRSGRSPVTGRFITFEPLEAHVRHDLIRLCVSIILSKEKASISGDTLIIQRRRFDPGKARNLGIPSGPLYGRLRSGETVRIGGEEVTPDMVMGEVPERFTIPGLSRYL